MKCSICRSVVCGIEPPGNRQDIFINVGDGLYAGITLTNNGKGVKVTKLMEMNQAIKVLRINDIITSLNGIPAVHHRDVINGINKATNYGYPIHITLYKNGDTLYKNLKTSQGLAQIFHNNNDDWVRTHTRV